MSNPVRNQSATVRTESTPGTQVVIGANSKTTLLSTGLTIWAGTTYEDGKRALLVTDPEDTEAIRAHLDDPDNFGLVLIDTGSATVVDPEVETVPESAKHLL